VKDIINSIEEKIGKLVDKSNQTQLERLNLQENNNALLAKLEQKEKEIIALQDKVKLMSISRAVDVTKEDAKATKLKINEYVREIDKCIALLNK
tara:strand:- start:340 stop:621 length:282 start_codon:yes stop_codon:yes gene_type:complete